ncbi:steroid 17-alpha-hydroxylase/17,20 lyase-like isoform X2 [Oculina patagonica]
MALVMECLNLGNVLLALLLVFMIYQLIDLYQFRGMPPGPRFTNLPLIGNLFSFNFDGEIFQDAVASLRRKYGKLFSLKLGSYKFVVAGSSEAVREVLVTRSADFGGRPKTYTLETLSLGYKDVAWSDGQSWKCYKRVLVSALRQHLSNTALIEERVTEAAGKLLQMFEDQKERSFDPAKLLDESIVEVLGRIIFGNDWDITDPNIDKLIYLNELGLKSYKDFQIIMLLDFFPFARYLPVKSHKKIFGIFLSTLEIIRHKLRERQLTFDPLKPGGNLMEALLHAQREAIEENKHEKLSMFSEDDLITTIQDMFTAGYETTAHALTFALGYLVQYPKYQLDIQKQLDDVVGRHGMPRLDDRPNLPLIHATIMESLRLGNVVPQALPHRAVQDTSLCGYRVPKNTIVYPDTEAVHLDPGCWENPKLFNPYRHIDKEGNLITNQGNFYPFGAGRRVCPGEALAKMEMYVFLSWMLHKFTFLPEEGQEAPEIKHRRAITQYPAPFKIRAIKRN